MEVRVGFARAILRGKIAQLMKRRVFNVGIAYRFVIIAEVFDPGLQLRVFILFLRH